MAKSKKSINDEDFMSDEHLDSVGDPVAVLDPDAGEDEAASDDAVVDESSDDVESDTDTPTDGDDAGDTEVVDDAGVDADTNPDDPAPQLTDLDAAKVAYAEVRKWANERDMAARKLQERIEQFEAAEAEYDYGVEPEPAYDPNAFTSIAAQDPRAAFQYALQAGNESDVRTAIAQVQTDANELSAMAALASRDGNQDAYQQLRAQSQHAADLAQQMQGEYQHAVMVARQAPLVQAENARKVQTAWTTLDQQTGGELSKHHDQVRRVLAERPHLLSGTSQEAIYRGYADAYAIARAQPTPEPGVSAGSIDEVVKMAVEKHVAATRQAKKAAAEAAAGGGGDRTAPTASGGEPSLKDEIYASQKAASMGARNFMDM